MQEKKSLSPECSKALLVLASLAGLFAGVLPWDRALAATTIAPFQGIRFGRNGSVSNHLTRDAAISAAIAAMPAGETQIVGSPQRLLLVVRTTVFSSGGTNPRWSASISYSRTALEYHTESIPPNSVGILTGVSRLSANSTAVPSPIPIVIGGNTLAVSPTPSGPGQPFALVVPLNRGGITKIECDSPIKADAALFNPVGAGDIVYDYTTTNTSLSIVPAAQAGELLEKLRIAFRGSSNHKHGSAVNSWTGDRGDNTCQALTHAPGQPQVPVDGQNTGDPVLLHSGEVEHRSVDLAIPGRGIDWEFARTYRSGIEYDGPIGHNWDMNYNARLSLGAPDCPVRLLDGNARGDCYMPQPDGGYASPTGFYTRFVVLQGDPQHPANGPMSVEIVNRHGVRSRFEGATGATTLPLTRITDRNGNALRLLHEDSAHPARLTAALDTFGRRIDYLYTDNRLTTVRDFAGREIVLGYDANGDLVSVRSPVVTGTPNGNDFPLGKTERYAYSSGFSNADLNHNLLSITAPNEVVAGGSPRVQFVYDETTGPNADRCLQQVYGGTNASGIPAGGAISYVFEVLAAGAPRDAVSKTTVTDRNGNVTEYFFDAAGRSLIVREKTRGLRAGDPAYFETHHYYNADGELTRTVFPEGNEMNYTYYTGPDRLQQGNLLEETRLPGPRAADQAFLKRTYAYEPVFNYLLSRTEERGNDPAFVPQNGGAQSAERYTTRYTFDYQEGDGVANLAFLAANTGRTTADLQTVLTAAGMAMNLPDQNGDGITASSVNARGSIVRIDHPTATLLAGSPQALSEGRTAQAAVDTLTYNGFGQKVFETNPEENVTQHLYFPETDPDGDGQDLLTTNGAGNPCNPATGGYLKQVVRDVGAPNRALPTDIGRESGQNPSFTQIKSDFLVNRVGVVTGILDGRGVRTDFFVNELNEIVQTTRAASVADVPARNGGLDGASEDLSGQGFAYKEQVFRDFNGNVVRRDVENRDGNTPDAGAHAGFIEYGYAFDILDDLIAETREVSPTETITWQHRYDANQNKVRTTFPEGNVFAWAFDERDLLLTMTRGLGSPEESTASYAYDGNRNPVRFTDAEDNNGDGLPESTLTAFDGFDRPKEVRDAAGNVAERHFDPASNLVLEKRLGPVGGATPNNNLGAGNVLLSQSEAKFDERSRAYQTDRVLFVPAGVSTARPVSLQEGPLTPGDNRVSTRFGFDRLGRLRFRQEDDLDLFQADFDGASRTIRTVDGEQNEILTGYDDGSNPVRVERIEKATKAGVADQRFVTLGRFDSLGRGTDSISNLGHRRRVSFDSRNNPIATSDAQGPPSTEQAMTTALVTLNAEGNTSRTYFDGINRPLRTEQDLRADGQGGSAVQSVITLRQEWDRNSRLKSRADDRGNVTAYAWNTRNLKTRETFADGTSNTWVLDRDDNVRAFTDANGSVRTQTLDALNRLIRCEVQRGSGVVGTTLQAWEFDGLSRTTKATDNNEPTDPADDSVVICAFDSLSRKLEEHQILGGNDQVVSSDWQDDDLRKALTYPNGRKLAFTWDRLDRLKTVEGVAGYEYIGPARLLERAYSNGTKMIPGYDGDQRVAFLRHMKGNQELAGFVYTHDREDNRLSEERTHVRHGGDTDRWVLDSAYRLVNQKRPQDEKTWTLDGTGSWTSLVIAPAHGQTTTLSQQVNSLNAYTAFGGEAQAEDQDGNKTDDGKFLYAWDFLHRLRTVSCKAGGEIVSTSLYDAYGAGMLNGSGRRIRKTVTKDRHGCSGDFEDEDEGDHEDCDDEDNLSPLDPAGFARRKASDVRYLFDGVQILEERDGSSGRLLRQYVHGSGLDEHLSMDAYKRNGRLKRTLFYHEDAKGWVVALSDKKGKVVERVTYDAYGVPTFTTKSGKLKRNQSESRFGNPFLYAGAIFDTETRLYQMRHRMYSPQQGRFYSRDPIGIYGDGVNGGNGYDYCGGNAVNFADPLGLFFEDTDSPTLAFWGTFLDPRTYMETLVSGEAGMTLIGYGRGVGEGAAGFVTGTVHMVAHPIDTARAIRELARHPEIIKCLLGSKYNEFVNASPAQQGRMIGEIVGNLSAGAVATMGVGELAGALRGGEVVESSGVWAQQPFLRGRIIEQALGANLPSNFPVIDRFVGGIATSIKSIDLGAVTYQNSATLSRTLNRYVESVAGFSGRPPWGGATVKASEIVGRELQLAVQPGSMSAAQRAVIEGVATRAQSMGVRFTVTPFP